MTWNLWRHRNLERLVGLPLAVAALLMLLPALSGCGREGDYSSLEGSTMGTYYRISARCPTVGLEQIQRSVERELDLVNAQMSTYLPDSELSRFNRTEPAVWMSVSGELVEVVDAATEISELSQGAFDVTVGPLIDLWGFGPDGAISAPPTPEAVMAARQRVGYRHLETRHSPTGLLKHRMLTVDLSAIAKGQGVDRLGGKLEDLDCTDFLVDIGGEVTGRGVNASGRTWRVGIEVPDPARYGAVQRVVVLDGVSVATSGDYRNFVDLDDGRYSHTIDPRTGRPVEHTLASVSVVHPSAMWADGLATALNVLGPEVGFELAEREGLAALFLIRRAAAFEERYTAAMLTHLEIGP
jgi:thiamine biosynthesis lipoprotein